MKAKKTYKAGGRAPEPLGMGAKKAKLKKAAPGRSARSAMFAEGAMNQMKANTPENRSLKAPGKTVAEIEEAKKKNKRRKRFDNGGKVKGTANVNTRGEGKKKEKPLNMLVDTRIADGPGRSEYVKQEKAAQGPLKKLNPKKASPVASKPSPAKKLKKGKAVIPVPPAKGRKRRTRK
jgi:hypothetical protein